MRRTLIVNADDFGLTDGVNRGIIECHEHGIVTSASLMMRYAAAKDAAKYARGNPRLGIGLHVDLGEWEFSDGEWRAVYAVTSAHDEAAVRIELARQLEQFRDLLGRDPDHLDSHQHAHREDPLKSILLEIAAELNIPVRTFDAAIAYNGGFYGQANKHEPYHEALTVDALITLIRELPAGITELACHPGYVADLRSAYRIEREMEVQTLCDPRVRAAAEEWDVVLSRFSDIKRLT